jgi:hypothetical protein
MNTGAAALILLVLAIVLASLPFLTERLFLVWSRSVKSVWLRLLELFVYYGVFLAIGLGLEAAVGRRHSQEWQFYAITVLMFLVLAYPGYVWRYLKRRSSNGG